MGASRAATCREPSHRPVSRSPARVSTEAVAAAIKDSAQPRTPLRIAGRATWLDAGRPCRADGDPSLRDDTGVVGYVPGDLTLTVRAGTPLSEIERVTREHDQWLPLDPYGSADGTIGATIATASAGPLASELRAAARPGARTRVRQRTRRCGARWRKGREERRRLRPVAASHRLVGNARRHHRGHASTLRAAEGRSHFRGPLDRRARKAAHRSFAPSSLLLSAVRAAAPTRRRRTRSDLGEHPVCLIRFGGNDAVVRAQLNALSQHRADPRRWSRRCWMRFDSCDGERAYDDQNLEPAAALSARPRRESLSDERRPASTRASIRAAASCGSCCSQMAQARDDRESATGGIAGFRTAAATDAAT